MTRRQFPLANEAGSGRWLSQGAATRPACQITQNLVADIGTVPSLGVCVKGQNTKPRIAPAFPQAVNLFLRPGVVEKSQWLALPLLSGPNWKNSPGREPGPEGKY
jgi:hypothetical protein